ncbi:MAG: MFS transporter [Bacteroidetes bacterium]|nr:MFS transporter [Bacteroidota bacterium]
MQNRTLVLIIIVLAQFCCTSLWFASNGVMPELIDEFQLEESALGHLTASVQLGFITGTLLFAFLAIVDRFSPSKVFLVSAFFGALCNLGVLLEANTLISLVVLRFFTGFFLAGIYPVGMKIAADYYEKGLGKSLAFLVGALVLGTALPHAIKEVSIAASWKQVIWLTSSMAALGGMILFLTVADGPYRKPSIKINPSAIKSSFKNRTFKKAAIGYFGHMWELYAFWAFVPWILSNHLAQFETTHYQVPALSFGIIGIGSISCVLAGLLSQKYGNQKVARTALFFSCLCCLISPIILLQNSTELLLIFLFFWGMVVIADSPLFSALVAQNTKPETKGTALTFVTAIGFAFSIISIQLLNLLKEHLSYHYLFMFLALGPIIGIWSSIKTKSP